VLPFGRFSPDGYDDPWRFQSATNIYYVFSRNGNSAYDTWPKPSISNAYFLRTEVCAGQFGKVEFFDAISTTDGSAIDTYFATNGAYCEWLGGTNNTQVGAYKMTSDVAATYTRAETPGSTIGRGALDTLRKMSLPVNSFQLYVSTGNM